MTLARDPLACESSGAGSDWPQPRAPNEASRTASAREVKDGGKPRFLHTVECISALGGRQKPSRAAEAPQVEIWGCSPSRPGEGGKIALLDALATSVRVLTCPCGSKMTSCPCHGEDKASLAHGMYLWRLQGAQPVLESGKADRQHLQPHGRHDRRPSTAVRDQNTRLQLTEAQHWSC